MGSRCVRECPALKKARLRRRWWRLATLGALCVLLYLTHPCLLRAAARWLDVSEPPASTDCVMVLGGGDNIRPFIAAALVKAGLAKEVLVPAARSVPQGDDLDPPEHEIIRRVLLARGVPPTAIVLLEKEVGSTFDEAVALDRFLQARPDCSVTIVTSQWHTRRARWIFRKQLGERAARIRFIGAPTEGFDENNWWRHAEGFQCYLNEYLKLLFYRLRY